MAGAVMKTGKWLVLLASLAILFSGCGQNSKESDDGSWKVYFELTGAKRLDVDVAEGSELSLWTVCENKTNSDVIIAFDSKTLGRKDVKVAKGLTKKHLLSFKITKEMIESYFRNITIIASFNSDTTTSSQTLTIDLHKIDSFSIEADKIIVASDDKKASTVVKVRNLSRAEKEIELSVENNNQKNKCFLGQSKLKLQPNDIVEVMFECAPDFESCDEIVTINATSKPSYHSDVYKKDVSVQISMKPKWDVCFVDNNKQEITVDAVKYFGKKIKIQVTNENDCQLELSHSLWGIYDEDSINNALLSIPPKGSLLLDWDVASQHKISKDIVFLDHAGNSKTLTLNVFNSEIDRLPYKLELVNKIPLSDNGSEMYPLEVNVDSGFLFLLKEFITLEMLDGKTIWKYKVNDIRTTTLKVKNDKIYFVSITDKSEQDMNSSTLNCISLTTGKLVWQKDIPNWYYRSEIFGKIGRLGSTESGVQPFWFNLETGARIEKEDIWSVETGYMVSKAFDHNVDLSCMKNAKVLWKLENSPGNGRILNTDQERVYWSTMSNLSSESRLSRLDIETGKMLWEKLMFPDDVNAYKDFVFVLNTISGTLDVLEASTGNLIGFINNVQSYPRIYSGYVCFEHIENDLKELHIYKIVKK